MIWWSPEGGDSDRPVRLVALFFPHWGSWKDDDVGDEDDFGVTLGDEDDFGVTQLTPVVIGEEVGERNVGPQVPEEGDYDEALSKICKIIINIQHRYQVPEDWQHDLDDW